MVMVSVLRYKINYLLIHQQIFSIIRHVSLPIHWNHMLKDTNEKQAKDDAWNLQCEKRLQQSDIHPFVFKTDCLFCGEKCEDKDPKHPDRWWNDSIITTVNGSGNPIFKEVIEIVSTKKWWAVKNGSCGTGSNLHAADARYHADCYHMFMQPKYSDNVCSNMPMSYDDDEPLKMVIGHSWRQWTHMEQCWIARYTL